jgi:hypothetical protein
VEHDRWHRRLIVEPAIPRAHPRAKRLIKATAHPLQTFGKCRLDSMVISVSQGPELGPLKSKAKPVAVTGLRTRNRPLDQTKYSLA